jgi:large subunit ribosomal protein L41
MAGAFQPTPSLLARAVRRLKLTTKQTNKGFYKGTRSGNVGHFSYNPKRYYIYEIDYAKVRTFVKPSTEVMKASQLMPFVAERVRAPAQAKKGKPLSGKEFLDAVKEHGQEIGSGAV